jgi:hypothetical protein
VLPKRSSDTHASFARPLLAEEKPRYRRTSNNNETKALLA